MMVGLPSLPNQELLADLCREAAQREGVEPQVIEKDFYLTRLIWAFAQSLGDHLLLKGGTLLSKVDLGFFRMSEDTDFVLPGEPSRTRRLNVARIDRVRASLHEVDELVGVRPEFPAGQLTDKAAHCEWRLVYPSEFGRQSIKLEVGIRPLFEPGRRVSLRQLIADPLLGSYENAYGFALSADEARAEKVRAAYTREAIRDFYDLERLRSLGVDLSSGRFVALVDRKLAELRAAPLSRQPPRVGMTARRHALLAASLRTELPSVLRANAPPFDLDDALDSLEQVWAPLRQS
jgi:predicted nucleotidyltransferase component of viral defense system